MEGRLGPIITVMNFIITAGVRVRSDTMRRGAVLATPLPVVPDPLHPLQIERSYIRRYIHVRMNKSIEYGSLTRLSAAHRKSKVTCKYLTGVINS